MAYTRNATEKVYQFIREKIEDQEWKEGERIWTESRLCEALGVSRVAVRQAVSRLVLEKRLYSIQGSGTYVQFQTGEDILDLGIQVDRFSDLLSVLEFRKYYECGTVALCIQNATEENLREIEHWNDVMYACGDDMETFYKADYNFHNAIAKGTRKDFIYRISQSMNKVLLQNQEKLNYVIGPDVGREYHSQILHYIKARDVELATLLMRKHIEAAIAAIRQTMKKSAG